MDEESLKEAENDSRVFSHFWDERHENNFQQNLFVISLLFLIFYVIRKQKLAACTGVYSAGARVLLVFRVGCFDASARCISSGHRAQSVCTRVMLVRHQVKGR